MAVVDGPGSKPSPNTDSASTLTLHVQPLEPWGVAPAVYQPASPWRSARAARSDRTDVPHSARHGGGTQHRPCWGTEGSGRRVGFSAPHPLRESRTD